MTQLVPARPFDQWLFKPTKEESICENPFHTVIKTVFSGSQGDLFFDPNLDPKSVEYKVAQLLYAGMILLEGDVIYVRERDNLIPLNEATNLLAYYMHSDTRSARSAADILESNFQGYFPVTMSKVWRNGITLVHGPNDESYIDLSTLTALETPPGIP